MSYELLDEELSERLSIPTDSPPYTDSNNNSDSDKSLIGDKYSLRPRSVRRRTASPVEIPKKRPPKPKQKPAPLSKYRRKTANARERSRMREINQAFETLRRVVPQLSNATTTPTHSGTNEKLTKITTLRLAMKYISTLSAALTGNSTTLDLNEYTDLDSCLDLLESDGESLPLHSDLSDHSDFNVDFGEDSLSPDFAHHLTHFDPFLSDFS